MCVVRGRKRCVWHGRPSAACCAPWEGPEKHCAIDSQEGRGTKHILPEAIIKWSALQYVIKASHEATDCTDYNMLLQVLEKLPVLRKKAVLRGKALL